MWAKWKPIRGGRHRPILKVNNCNIGVRTLASHMGTQFLDHCIVLLQIFPYLPTHNRPKFVRKFLKSVSRLLGIRRMNAITYYAQSSDQAELFNRTILTRLRNYVTEHQRNWDLVAQPLTVAYITQVHDVQKHHSTVSCWVEISDPSILTASRNMPVGSLDAKPLQTMVKNAFQNSTIEYQNKFACVQELG